MGELDRRPLGLGGAASVAGGHLLLSCRVDDAELVKALSLFRQKAHDVTFSSRTHTQLFDSMRELSVAYDAVMEVIGEKLKGCVKGR